MCKRRPAARMPRLQAFSLQGTACDICGHVGRRCAPCTVVMAQISLPCAVHFTPRCIAVPQNAPLRLFPPRWGHSRHLAEPPRKPLALKLMVGRG